MITKKTLKELMEEDSMDLILLKQDLEDKAKEEAEVKQMLSHLSDKELLS